MLQPLAILLVGGPQEVIPDKLRPQQMLALWWATLLALLVAHLVSVRFVERWPWSTVGLDPGSAQPALLGRGALLGGLAIGVPTALVLLPGWLTLEETTTGSWWAAAAWLAVFLAPAALAEELMLRGYPFAVLREVWGWRATLLVTSIAFGLLHLANVRYVGDPGIGAQAIALVTLAGIFLGAILVATGSLYAAGMAHLAWNWVMAAIFHAPVSGLPMTAVDYRVVDAGPDWITGGPWGPEAGVGAGLGMAAGLAYLYRYSRRRAPAGGPTDAA